MPISAWWNRWRRRSSPRASGPCSGELAAAAPVAVSRSELIRRVWGFSRSADTRLLDIHVCRLRNKIEPDPRRPRLVRTVRGVGYQAVPAW
ncbi:winged helix-turn-helix domain-containing protein [Amycolatopsis solani]|uniref:winged helix-turn-helix domain-containing protein n=1 Tax=Amycolatopsis solani TaxID=3028615 RepID=UPI00339D8F75